MSAEDFQGSERTLMQARWMHLSKPMDCLMQSETVGSVNDEAAILVHRL